MRYRRGALVHGKRGYEYEVYERLPSSGVDVLVRCGWTAGNRRDAEQEAARTITELEADRAKQEAA